MSGIPPEAVSEAAAGRSQLEFDDNLLLPLLYGERDQNLDRIERQLGVSLVPRSVAHPRRSDVAIHPLRGAMAQARLAITWRRGDDSPVLAAFLGSDLWTHASQAIWQHGPAALALIAALALSHPGPVARWRLALAGVAVTGLFAALRLSTG